ncbi:chloride channel protein [Sideroxydans lithotrophicus]|uniref:Cl-channel voltage-gated family protein n=1 Tax=Sideroxydans lithotrophicus (strain ES-1) TaxID=580332 RepID=D5CPZ6_SIDLE|nr:chloride channel protein [Sideroxydans lithotrophicus]ADE11160.1 Cl- channel voltage-gated family protein [Sideroxydans lithotrophicus ES-1]
MKISSLDVDLILDWKRRLVFWSGAISVGLAAILFAIACEWANDVFHKLLAISPYLPLLITPISLALIVHITRKYFSGAQGSGIPQVIASLDPKESSKVREQVLSLRVTMGKIMLTILGLMSGTSVGREGPTVQIGASIMHKLGSLARFPKHDLDKGLILAGAAAGVAAAFNTPLAGIVFAIEEMSRSFEEHNSSTILMTVIIAGIVSLALLGNYSYFGHTSESMDFGKEWYVVIVCGIVGGTLGGAFSRALIEVNKGLAGSMGTWIRANPVRFAAVCGLLLALIGLASGNNTYGSGYNEAKSLLVGNAALPDNYGLLKMAATVISYISGIPGGIMAPTLSAGAGFGANIASFVTSVPVAATVILGMVAYFAGVTQAPITAFVIVMEMIDNHEMVLPLMATAFIAKACSRLVCPTPIFHTMSENFIGKK